MNPFFEVSGDGIAKLSDADLRVLVGRLCLADYRRAQLPTTGRYTRIESHPDLGQARSQTSSRVAFRSSRRSLWIMGSKKP